MAFRFRPVYYNEVKSPFFIVNNTKSVYELSKICMSFFMFMLYGRLLNLLPTKRNIDDMRATNRMNMGIQNCHQYFVERGRWS